MRKLTTPIPDEDIKALKAGDPVSLNGIIVTRRDAAHKFMIENFIRTDAVPAEEADLYEKLKPLLDGGVIYHCGPVVKKDEAGSWQSVGSRSARDRQLARVVPDRFAR